MDTARQAPRVRWIPPRIQPSLSFPGSMPRPRAESRADYEHLGHRGDCAVPQAIFGIRGRSCLFLTSVSQKTPFPADFPTKFQMTPGPRFLQKPKCPAKPLNHPLSPIFGQTPPLPSTNSPFLLQSRSSSHRKTRFESPPSPFPCFSQAPQDDVY